MASSMRDEALSGVTPVGLKSELGCLRAPPSSAADRLMCRAARAVSSDANAAPRTRRARGGYARRPGQSRLWPALWMLGVALIMVGGVGAGESQAEAEQFRALDQQTQDLKQEVLNLNRDLFLLEEELLFPSSTQVTVFLSMDVGEFFALDSVQLKIDDKVVTSYLYTQREVAALHRGGVQRLHVDNLKAGEHEIVAILVGKGPQGRDYRRGANLVFEKGLSPKFLELRIVDSTAKHQPDFEIKDWQ